MHPRYFLLLLLAFCGLAAQPVRAQFVTPLVAPSRLILEPQPSTSLRENKTKIHWRRGDGTNYVVLICNMSERPYGYSNSVVTPDEKPFPTQGNYRMEPSAALPTLYYWPSPTYILRTAAYQNDGDTTAAVLNTQVGTQYQVKILEFTPDSAGNKSGYYTSTKAGLFVAQSCPPVLVSCVRSNDREATITWSTAAEGTSRFFTVYASTDSTTFFTNSATQRTQVAPRNYGSTYELPVYNVLGSTPIYYKIRLNSGTDELGYTDLDTKAFTVTEKSLPVVLTSFEAKRLATGVQLTWATASELNNAGFQVQRSADTHTWQTLRFLAGAGTTLLGQRYQASDLGNEAAAYYRLAQQDLDGSLHYSPVRYVAGSAAAPTLSAYPNPSLGQEVQISGADPSQSVQLLTASGQLMREITGSTLTTTGLAPGVYILRQSSKVTRLVIK